MKKLISILVLSLSALLFVSSSSQDDPIVGLCMTKEGKGKVKIFTGSNREPTLMLELPNLFTPTPTAIEFAKRVILPSPITTKPNN